MTESQPGISRGTLVAMLVITWAALFALRLHNGSNIMDDDQERPATYLTDLMVNHHYFVQWDTSGEIMSKPPFYTWCSAALAAVGGINEFTLYLTGALAVLAIVLILFYHGSSMFGVPAGFLGAAMFLMSNPSVKLVHLARTDGVFALLVYAAMIAAHAAYRGRCSWFWFWALSAAATITKGPLGPVLAAASFLALYFAGDKERNVSRSAFPGHAAGILFFLITVGGLFLAAYHVAGHALIDKLFVKELIGHAEESGNGDFIGSKIYQPPFYFVSRFAPWSLLTLMGIWRAFRGRKAGTAESFFAVLSSCYFIFGMIIFSLSPHQRFDHQFPLIPAAALLAGREAAILLGGVRFRRAALAFPVIAILFLCGMKTYHYLDQTKDERDSRMLKEIAAKLKSARAEPIYGDALMGLQFYMGSNSMKKPPEEICELLHSGAPIVLITQKYGTWRDIRDCYRGPIFKVAEWDSAHEDDGAMVIIYSNREDFRLSPAPNNQNAPPTPAKKSSTP